MRYFLIFLALLVLCVGLLSYLVCGHCRPHIEESLTHSARQALDKAGLTEVDATFDRLDASLTGNVANQGDRLKAAKVIAGIDGARLLASNNHLTERSLLPARLEILRDVDGAITLTGQVPGEAIRNQIATEMSEANPGLVIDNRLEVSSTVADSWWTDDALLMSGQFLEKTQGIAAMQFGPEGLAVEGTVPTEGERSELVSALTTTTPTDLNVNTDDLSVVPPTEVVVVEAAALDLSVDGENITVSGRVHDEATKAGVLASLRTAKPDHALVDELDIDSTSMVPPWATGVSNMLDSYLPAVETGAFQIGEQGLVLSGTVSDEATRMRLEDEAIEWIGTPDRVSNQLAVLPSEPEVIPEAEAALVSVFKESAIYFASGSRALLNKDVEKIRQLAETVKASSGVRLFVGGYADKSGNPEANRQLSLARATVVKNRLVEFGVREDSLVVESFGAEEMSADELWKGRRVELSIQK